MTITKGANLWCMSAREAGITALHQRIPFLLSQLGIYLA
jgi:hypothetical protein